MAVECFSRTRKMHAPLCATDLLLPIVSFSIFLVNVAFPCYFFPRIFCNYAQFLFQQIQTELINDSRGMFVTIICCGLLNKELISRPLFHGSFKCILSLLFVSSFVRDNPAMYQI